VPLFRLHNLTLAFILMALSCFVADTTAPIAHAQTNITGAVVGVISDSTGAFVPSATVTITNQANGATHVVTTSATGEYRVSQLSPGRYSITVTAPGFEKANRNFDVGAGTVDSANITLPIGTTSATVEVSGGAVPLLHVDDAQISTTYTEEQILLLPNPGNDLTFVAQTAPGSMMNTQGGYGNFSSFGLPATSNTYTINGGFENDMWNNLNLTGATNLLLGQNDVATETVISNAYNASFGGFGGAQVNEITRSGGNQFHGNAAYWWNGSVMNANDYFNKDTYTSPTVTPRLFDNANQYVGAFGGPIKRNKLFFFVNFEGLNLLLPVRTTIYAPDPTYQANVLSNLTANGLASELTVYKNIFALYNNAPNYSSGTETPNCTTAPYCTWTFNGHADSYIHEYLINPRGDWNIGENDHLFAHGTIDHGWQSASSLNTLNSMFNVTLSNPIYEGQVGETHIFSPALSNQFLATINYYQCVFRNPNLATAENTTKGGVPFTLIFADGEESNTSGSRLGGNGYPGGMNYAYPGGRNVLGYTFGDDLSWTKGKHTLSVGWTMRRNDITDFDPGEYNFPEAIATNSSFEQGLVDEWMQTYSARPSQPAALYDMGWYGQDQWKISPSFTLTLGLRMEHDSNVICRKNCFARLSNNFVDLSSAPDTPYDSLISYNQTKAMNNYQSLSWEPRIGFAYLPFGINSRTTIRGGFGMFSDAFPGKFIDSVMLNVPTENTFSLYGPAYSGPNYLLVPGATTTSTSCSNPAGCPGSASAVASSSNTKLAADFLPPINGSYTSISSAISVFTPPSITSPQMVMKYPTYEMWSLAIEQQLGEFNSLAVEYVGNHGYHELVQNNGLNTYSASAGTGFFPEVPTTAANPSFSKVTELSSSGVSNYNGLAVAVQHRSKTLTLTFNYQWSHTLDETSNGGLEAYGNNSVNPTDPYDLRKNYGNADYDIRHYVSSSYVYSLPHFWGPKLLVDNWQAAGTVFHSTGLPFSVVDGTTALNLSNYGGPLFAKQSASISGHTQCGGKGAAQGIACSFVNDYTSATDFGQSRRNQLRGPNYTDVDLSIIKGFQIPKWQTGKVTVGVQFFNLFNHPNFASPANDLASPGTIGTITSGVSAPTSILGSGLGGDASPRLIQLVAKFSF
jgi:hypothetical protein